jgi:hypothetical protein
VRSSLLVVGRLVFRGRNILLAAGLDLFMPRLEPRLASSSEPATPLFATYYLDYAGKVVRAARHVSRQRTSAWARQGMRIELARGPVRRLTPRQETAAGTDAEKFLEAVTAPTRQEEYASLLASVLILSMPKSPV